MDLGISGKAALVTGASAGIGRAIARALAAEGVKLAVVARRRDLLESLERDIGAKLVIIEQDFMAEDAAGRIARAALAGLGAVDILVNNAGGSRRFQLHTDEAQWHEALTLNFTRQRQLADLLVDQMIARKWGRIVNITSAAVRSPIDILGLSNGARAGLTGFVAGLSRKTIANGVTINNLLPGPFLTDRIRSTAQAEAKAKNISADDVVAHRAKENPAGRIGDPAEFGAACAFLCSAHAGFMTGQNILLDGGAFRGTM